MSEPGPYPIEVDDGSLNPKKDPRRSNPKELLDIISRASEGDSSAKEELISKFEWLIDRQITLYFDEYRDSCYDDLMQEGKLAILKFLEDFDPNKSDDPYFFIRNAIYWRLINFVRRNQQVNTGGSFNDIQKYKLTKARNPQSDDAFLRNAMGVSEDEFEGTKKATLSLEAFEGLDIDETGEAEGLNRKWQQSVDGILADKELANEISKAITACCTPSQVRAARLRFGLTDGQPKSLQQVADILGTTRSNVGQLVSSAINKTRKYLQIEIDQQPTVEPPEERAIPEKTTSERRLGVVERVIEGDNTAKGEFIKEFQTDIHHIIIRIFYFLEDSYYDQLKHEAESALFKSLENVKKDEFEDNKSHYSQIINDKSWFSHIIVNSIWNWVDQNKPKMKDRFIAGGSKNDPEETPGEKVPE